MKKILILSMIIFLGLFGCAAKDSSENQNTSSKHDNIVVSSNDTLENLMKSANQGDKDAQYNLAIAYRDGNGVPVNKEEAFKWFKKAAENGHVEAQADLSRCYFYGYGTPVDKKEALKWMQIADKGLGELKQDLANKEYELALRYFNDDRIPNNKEKAVEFFRKAAEQGHAEAQYNLGVCYYYGRGVSVNKEESLKWFKQAAKQGHKKAQELLDGLGVK